jgi:hypothetical protein
MTDLAERLDDLAREATAPVAFADFPAAARTRRRRKRLTGVTAAVAAVAVVVALILAVNGSAPKETVQIATPTTLRTPVGGMPAVWVKVAIAAEHAAIEYGDSSPTSAVGVMTDSASAAERTTLNPLGGPYTEVYLVVLKGQFSCGVGTSCADITSPVEPYLIYVLDADSFSTFEATPAAVPPDLTGLGTVYPVAVTSGPSRPNTSTASSGCPASVLDAPIVSSEPTPTDVTTPITFGQYAPALEPPTGTPVVTAAAAWAIATNHGLGPFQASGPVKLVLGDSHGTLVWAAIGYDQPLSPVGPAGYHGPTCYLGTWLIEINARSGATALMTDFG